MAFEFSIHQLTIAKRLGALFLICSLPHFGDNHDVKSISRGVLKVEVDFLAIPDDNVGLPDVLPEPAPRREVAAQRSLQGLNCPTGLPHGLGQSMFLPLTGQFNCFTDCLAVKGFCCQVDGAVRFIPPNANITIRSAISALRLRDASSV